MSIIEVSHLTKEFQLGHVANLKNTVINFFKKITFQKVIKEEPFKALDDLSFTIESGEVVGLVGHNGAGKSTLLKHLANISKPTSGTVKVHGKVVPLIEVGAGINPELTGRENIFLNAAIMGVPKKIIRQQLDEIIEFSELEEFIDTPVKRYSSGMRVKLGFSIASSIKAEIIIIDEILSVGDLTFQRKCFERMEEMIKNESRTVLVVSHNIRQILRICDRVILLNKGEIVDDGDPDRICARYMEECQKKISKNHTTYKDNHIQTSGEVELRVLELIDENNNPTHEVEGGEELKVRLVIYCNKRLENPAIVIGTHTTDFIYLTAHSTRSKKLLDVLEVGEYEFIMSISSIPLKPAKYFLRLSIGTGPRTLLNGDSIFSFDVTHHDNELHFPPNRNLDLPCSWTINRA